MEQDTLMSIQKMKIKISLQDMHLLFLIIKYANENVSKEYMKKLEKIEEYLKRSSVDD